MRAFNLVKAQYPTAILQIVHAVPENCRQKLLQLVPPEYRSDVHFETATPSEKLPEIYGRAAVTVLPSYREVFGMVLIESMATGTPVVGTRHGGIPDVICTDCVGQLFEPGPEEGGGPSNFEGLANAIVETLQLSRRESTAEHCRAHVAKYAWPVLGEFLEEIYRQLVEERALQKG